VSVLAINNKTEITNIKVINVQTMRLFKSNTFMIINNIVFDVLEREVFC